MPTMHIPDSLFAVYVDRAGGYQEAKEEIKRQLRNGVQDANTEN